MIEAMEEAGVERGLPREIARGLAAQTCLGAGKMALEQISTEPATLRKNVTSPNGTTEAGVKVLEARSAKQIIKDCVIAATKRGDELGDILGRQTEAPVPKMSTAPTPFEELFSEGIPNSPPNQTTRLPCTDCRSLRKRCDRRLPECARCVKRGVPCSYRKDCESRNRPSASTWEALPTMGETNYKPHPINPTKSRNKVSAISQRLSEAENHLSILASRTPASVSNNIQTPILEPGNLLESRDMLPTFQDWAIVCSYMTKSPYSIIGILGGFEELLESFFSQPPHLWLSLCAVASQLQEPKLPEHVRYSYYARAQSALVKNFHILDFRMYQSLMIFTAFSAASGNPDAGRSFFFQGIVLLLRLRLDIDPDDSPWLFGLNLSDREKNKRRTGFWVAYHFWKISQIVVGSPLRVQLKNDKVKFSRRFYADSPFYDEYPERSEIATICYLCAILDVLESAATLYRIPPAAVTDLTESVQLNSVKAQLQSLKSQIPTYMFLLDRSCDRTNDLFAFVSDIRMTEMKVADVLTTSLLLHSAICIANRGLLFLTGFLPATNSDSVSNGHEAKILLALDESVTSARTILFLVSWLWNRSESCIDGDFGRFRRRFWKMYAFYSMTILEAAIVAWFATCRTHPSWWQWENSESFAESVLGGRLRMSIQDRRIVRAHLSDALRTLKGLQEDLSPKTGSGGCESSGKPSFTPSSANMVTPMIEAVDLMMQDMARAEALAEEGGVSVVSDAEKGPMRTIGMRVTGLSADDYEHTQPHEGYPWSFLGLLGMRIGAERVDWRSERENEWRAFWAKVGSKSRP
ncbi:hypothetical protein HDU84_008349 [Entophlyctis sp. JEL0112]|nr:hypothetical protein HDU84_008349 [Entophlyctis sp. JEL0112]